MAWCAFLRCLGEPQGSCYDLSSGACRVAHPHADCPLRRFDDRLPELASATGVEDFTATLLFETLSELRRSILNDFTAAKEVADAAPVKQFAGWADPFAPPFEKRFVSEEVGFGLFATTDLPRGFVIGEYGGLLRSEAAALALETPDELLADSYRLAYPAVDAANGSSLFVTAKRVGGWARLVNHAPAAGTNYSGVTTPTPLSPAAADTQHSNSNNRHNDAAAPSNDNTNVDDDDPSKWVANSAFVTVFQAGLPRVLIVTTCPIASGQQILVDYGREYWLALRKRRSRQQPRADDAIVSTVSASSSTSK